MIVFRFIVALLAGLTGGVGACLVVFGLLIIFLWGDFISGIDYDSPRSLILRDVGMSIAFAAGFTFFGPLAVKKDRKVISISLSIIILLLALTFLFIEFKLGQLISLASLGALGMIAAAYYIYQKLYSYTD